MTNSAQARPVGLIILDGWGYRENPKYNAIAQANTPNWNRLLETYPQTFLDPHGLAVGLPDGQMGNSEVGHLNLGAGRVVYQDLTRIDRAIRDGSFQQNQVLLNAITQAKTNDKALHILGLFSDGGVHSSLDHIIAFVKLAAQEGASKIYVHAFTDGRDVAPKCAHKYVKALEKAFAEVGVGRIASVVGRYYAMDRDKRWERVEKAYNLITSGKGDFQAQSASEALDMAYGRGENDEFIKATAILDSKGHGIRMEDGDHIVFMNFRADRVRQLTEAFMSADFSNFTRLNKPRLGSYVTLTEFHKNYTQAKVAFPTEDYPMGLSETLSKAGLSQLHTAETEKYAHVTFFFNGGLDEPFPGEDRILVPSPKVATYDLAPEMSVYEVAHNLVEDIKKGRHDVFICNFANPDMVGHSGNLTATIRAVEAVDKALGQVMAAVEAKGGEMFVTADHGNAEILFDEQTQQPHTAHTTNPVKFVYFGRRQLSLKSGGTLCNVAPSMLSLLNIPQPAEMTCHSLVEMH